ncbi:hypothetical protein EWM64_g4153 [Hericium alpestre]|uniref:DUF431-domain-containing protein n=1 Tax=Hericium alpestre TaxID=135208 RepID=A0A4Z0A0B0_9AGAM|nr:hypothetical protein EWM64_g4153 [Hericium alpestre]
MGFTYVVEHMEEDEPASGSGGKTLPRWVELEYTHMLTFAGSSSSVLFTHLSPSASSSLASSLSASSPSEDKARFESHTKSVMSLMDEHEVPLSKVCLLDPKAESELEPEDGDGRFEWFLFGGILGDDPPRDRTAELRVLGFPSRRLGPVQMTTDTALGVTKIVVEKKIPLDEIPYVVCLISPRHRDEPLTLVVQDQPTITFNARESVEMPFRYIADAKGEPRLPPGMKEHLQEDLNQSFEF